MAVNDGAVSIYMLLRIFALKFLTSGEKYTVLLYGVLIVFGL